jgi:hypothetical protein
MYNWSEILFDRMDSWRHLPNYQLERRADLFFSLYLPMALEAKLGISIHPIIVPEFPVRIGTIYPNIEIDKSYKIDYVCFSQDLKTAIFVELKTEGLSRREKQDKYLSTAQDVGFASLLDGLLKIFKATNAKRKYFCLLKVLSEIGFLKLPSKMEEIVKKDSLVGINAFADSIAISCEAKKPIVVYLQPNGQRDDVLTFEEFSRTVEKFDDELSRRFAKSLREWAAVQAGESL